MKNTTLVLLTIVIACCLIVSQTALADSRYSLTGPTVVYGNGGILDNLILTPTVGHPTMVKSGGTPFGTADSFFDVFTELTLPAGNYQVDSFFDITYKIDLGGGQFQVDSFFDVFVEIDLDVPDGPGPVITQMAPLPQVGSIRGTIPSSGETSVTDRGNDQFHVDSFFDILSELSVDGGGTFTPSPGPALMRFYPDGVPTPREVHGKEYSHHMDLDAQAVPDPMQNLAWDGTGNAWDTFDYNDALNIDWEQGTNVDAIASIQDRLFHDVVADKVALLVTLDDGAATAATVPGDYENIHYQTAGPNSQAGIWAKGVIPGVPAGSPPTSDIHTVAVQLRASPTVDPNHTSRWLSPTGIEVWGPQVQPGDAGQPGTGDNAIMFSTNDEWDAAGAARPAVWKYDPTNNIVFPYLMANQVRMAIDNAGLNLVQDNIEIDLDGMMIYDLEKDDQFGPGDSIMFTVHSVPNTTGGFLLDGGEIWVWKFDDGPNGAQFLNHGGVLWDTANSVIGVFPNVMGQENIGGLEAVPEPATMSMLVLGGLALLRRKRRKM